jgi:hypothetical protein
VLCAIVLNEVLKRNVACHSGQEKVRPAERARAGALAALENAAS